MVSDRFSAYNHLPTQQRQLCWAHLIRDLTAIAERPGARPSSERSCSACSNSYLTTGTATRTERSTGPPCKNAAGRSDRPLRSRCSRWWSWATSAASERRGPRPCAPLRDPAAGRCLWTFLETRGIEPTNNAAERALRQSVIQRKISHGVQSRQGAIYRSRLLTVTTSLRQQGRDVWPFLEQAWIPHHRGGVMPSLLPDP